MIVEYLLLITGAATPQNTNIMRKIELTQVSYSELPKGYSGSWKFEDGIYVPSSDLKYFQDLDKSWEDRETRIVEVWD